MAMVDVQESARAEHARDVTVKAVNYVMVPGNAQHAEAQQFVQVVVEKDSLL
jgi:hypothetical protein